MKTKLLASGRSKIGLVLCVLGVCLAIFGIIWMTVVWPNLSKLPRNLEQQVNIKGTVKLYDAAAGGPVAFDVSGARKYAAVSASDDIVWLQEDIWFNIAGTDPPQEISAIRAQYLMAIDRVTRQHVEGRGDGIGGGYFGHPFNVQKDKAYPWWNEGTPVLLDNVYVSEMDFQGLHVYVVEMSTPEGGVATPASFDTPAMTIEQKVTMYVEPVTGSGVYMEGLTKRTGMIPVPDPDFPATAPMTYQKVTFYEDSLTFTQETIDDLVDIAAKAKTQIKLAKDLLPWLSIGLGTVLVLGGLLLILRFGRPAAGPSGSPETK